MSNTLYPEMRESRNVLGPKTIAMRSLYKRITLYWELPAHADNSKWSWVLNPMSNTLYPEMRESRNVLGSNNSNYGTLYQPPSSEACIDWCPLYIGKTYLATSFFFSRVFYMCLCVFTPLQKTKFAHTP